MNLNLTEEESGNETERCITVLDKQEFTNVSILSLAISIVSFIAGILVIAFILLTKKWKFFGERLILYLTITALLFSAANTINRVDLYGESSFLTGFCAFTGALTQVSSWMTFFAISSITFYLFFRTALNRNTERYEWVYILLTFFSPLLFNWIPFIHMLYGKSGLWCWIRSFDFANCEVILLGRWFQFSLLYIPAYLLLVVLLILYVIIIVKIVRMRRLEARKNDPNANKLTRKILSEVVSLLVYPFIYFLLSIPPLLNRIYSSVESNPNLFLWYISGIAFPMHGLFAAITFTVINTRRQNLTWANIRARVMRGKKAVDYPMKPDEISDSMLVRKTLSTHPHAAVKYTEYSNPKV